MKHFFKTEAEKNREKPLREIWGGNYTTNFWGKRTFSDGSTYQRDWLTGKVKTKGRFGLWGKFF